MSRAFAAEVAGIDLREPLSDRQTSEIVAAMDRYAVLVFRDQPLDDAQQMAFARCFGPLQDERGGSILRDDELRIARVFADISNLDTDGAMLGADDHLPRWSCAYLDPTQAPPAAQAGDGGAQLLVLRLPARPMPGPGTTASDAAGRV